MSKDLWQYMTDEDQHKLKDLKHAPLIHEVSGRVFPSRQKPNFLALKAQMSVCRHYQGKAPALDCRLFRCVRANHGLYFTTLLGEWRSYQMRYSGVYLTAD